MIGIYSLRESLCGDKISQDNSIRVKDNLTRAKGKDIKDRDKDIRVKVTGDKVIKVQDIKVKDKDISDIKVMVVTDIKDDSKGTLKVKVTVREVWEIIHSINQTKVGEVEDISKCQIGRTNSVPLSLQSILKMVVASVEDQVCS